MKKALKIVGILLGVIVLVALGGFVYINSSGIPSYEPMIRRRGLVALLL